MRKRRRLPPDTRPNWRDPNMPVLAQHREKGLIPIEPERLSKVARIRLDMCTEPTYDRDPTYNLRKDRK